MSNGPRADSSATAVGGPDTSVAGADRAEARGLRADAARNHERILRAAEEVFARDGVAVPVDAVAAQAGVGVGTLYRHFPTKESLFEAIVTTRVAELAGQARLAAASSRPGAALFAFLGHLGRTMAGKRDLIDAMASAGIDVKSDCSQWIEELELQLGVAITRAQEEGSVRPDIRAKELLRLLGATAHAVDPDRSEAAVDRLVTIISEGIRAHPA